MICNNCGKEIQDGTKFCPYCGADTSSSVTEGPARADFNTVNQAATATADTPYVSPVMGILALVFSGCILGAIFAIIALTKKSKANKIMGGIALGISIFVIVIIAAVVIPTTIGVASKATKNNAIKIAENSLNAAETVLLEANAGCDVEGVKSGTAIINYSEVGVYYITVDSLVANGDIKKNPFDSTSDSGCITSSKIVYFIDSRNTVYIGYLQDSEIMSPDVFDSMYVKVNGTKLEAYNLAGEVIFRKA